ncbi:MAG: hypothetical protein ACLGRW_20035 [Acidobacteriota bacterium]
MQPKRFSWMIAVRLAGLLLVAGMLGTAAQAQFYGGTYTGNKKDAPIDVSTYPANIQRAYKSFKYTCSECHTLDRALRETDTPATAKHWVYLMQAKPAADFNDREAERIIEFLNYYHAHPPKDNW